VEAFQFFFLQHAFFSSCEAISGANGQLRARQTSNDVPFGTHSHFSGFKTT